MQFFDTACLHAPMIGQFEFVFIVNQALNKVNRKDWITTFEKVNLPPTTQVPFSEYILRVKSVAKSADFFNDVD